MTLPKLIPFIISHGRPDNVKTYETLRKCGYHGRVIIVVDNLDSTVDEYRKRFDDVVVFDKKAIADTFDIGDNFDNYRSTSYARNACFDIAEQLGIEYFIVLDDDYVNFRYSFDKDFNWTRTAYVSDLEKVFDVLLSGYINSGADSLTIAQGGDYLGGEGSSNPNCTKIWFKRKAMNSFICSTKRRFTCISRMNEDVNTYIRLGSTGTMFFMSNQIFLDQAATQASTGGMTELYKATGTYVKSFYSVMYMPSCVKVRSMHSHNPRLHHAIRWRYTVPKILSEDVKKAERLGNGD